jgi:hypothetical protein
MDKFSAVSVSGDAGGLVRSCAPHWSPDRLRGRACFLRGWGEVRWSIGGGRFSLKEICGMCGSCGSFRGGS